jgi:hypothetical protein
LLGFGIYNKLKKIMILRRHGDVLSAAARVRHVAPSLTRTQLLVSWWRAASAACIADSG